MPYTRSLSRSLVLAVLVLLVTAPAGADERALLTRIQHELDAIREMARQAEAQGGRGRVRFQYGALDHDLKAIQAGIDEYLINPSETPTVVAPLRGDYRR